MQASDKSQYRTYTMCFMKKGIYQGVNYSRGSSSLNRDKKNSCGSILEIVNFCDSQKKNKVKSEGKQLRTIHYQDLIIEKTNQTTLNARLPKFEMLNNQALSRSSIKNRFRLKYSPKADTLKKEERRRQFEKIMNDLNAKTVEIFNRSITIIKDICKQGRSKGNSSGHNSYTLQAAKKKPLQNIQRKQIFQIDDPISPW